MHQREQARLLDVQCSMVRPLGQQQPAPPATAALGKTVDRCGKPRQHRLVVHQHAGHVAAKFLQQAGVATDRMGIQEDRQVHQRRRGGHHQPFTHLPCKGAGGLAPLRVAEHDVPGARRVTKTLQGFRKPGADGLQVVTLKAVAQHQCVVLVGLQQLLAPAFAAHHKQATVGHQCGRCHQRPRPLEQPAVQLAHLCRDHVDTCATPVKQANQPGDLRGGCLQGGQVLCAEDLHPDEIGVVGQEAEQIQRLQNAVDVLPLGHHHPVHLVAQHHGQGLPHRVGWPHGDQVKVGQFPHRQLVERGAVQDGALQCGGGEDAHTGRRAVAVAHQHVHGTFGLEQAHHRDNIGGGVHAVCGPHKGLVHPRHAQRLQLVLAVPLGQSTEFVREVGKQERAKGGVGRDQLADGLLLQRVGHNLLTGHEAAADLARHQRAAVEAIVGAVGGHHLAAVELLHEAFDDDKQVGGGGVQVQHRLVGPEIGDVHMVAHQLLLGRAQAVERGGRKIEGVRHGWRSGVCSAPIQRRRPCATLAAASQSGPSNQGSPAR